MPIIPFHLHFPSKTPRTLTRRNRRSLGDLPRSEHLLRDIGLWDAVDPWRED